MLQDVEAQRQTEIDYLNGGIARFGRELGVPTPLHDTITALVKGVEASWLTAVERNGARPSVREHPRRRWRTHGLDALVVSGNEYSGSRAPSRTFRLQIVHRYA